jgi:hypothetical protein
LSRPKRILRSPRVAALREACSIPASMLALPGARGAGPDGTTYAID